MITKENLIEDLKAVRTKIGKIPSKIEYQKHGVYGKNTIGRKWGSWTLAMNDIFLDYEQPKKSIIKSCAYCDTRIKVLPSQLKEKNYCSVSCGNKDKPRRKPLPRPKCATCNNRAPNRKAKYCKQCHKRETCSFHLKTLGDVREKNKDATRYSHIRGHARAVMKKSGVEKCCKNCNYDTHVQTCHVKSICKYPDKTLVGDVNDLANLVYLCPNCHWEFDHGLLKL